MLFVGWFLSSHTYVDLCGYHAGYQVCDPPTFCVAFSVPYCVHMVCEKGEDARGGGKEGGRRKREEGEGNHNGDVEMT